MVNCKTWDYAQVKFALGGLESDSRLFVFVCSWLYRHDTKVMMLQLANVQHHLTGIWVWFYSWDGLRMGIPCIHFQQILNQSQVKFSVVYCVSEG
jgi:hypothetical protein